MWRDRFTGPWDSSESSFILPIQKTMGSYVPYGFWFITFICMLLIKTRMNYCELPIVMLHSTPHICVWLDIWHLKSPKVFWFITTFPIQNCKSGSTHHFWTNKHHSVGYTLAVFPSNASLFYILFIVYTAVFHGSTEFLSVKTPSPLSFTPIAFIRGTWYAVYIRFPDCMRQTPKERSSSPCCSRSFEKNTPSSHKKSCVLANNFKL